MVTPEELTARGLRAYEFGRLRSALRVALVVIPGAALCLVERTGRSLALCLAVVLLAAAVWLRWRDRHGMEAVKTGLVAGSVPLLAGLLLERLGLRCSFAGADSFCTTLAVLLGAGAGMLISMRQARFGARLSGVLTAGAVAGLAAALGCVRLGTVGVASMVVGIALGSFAGARVANRAR